MSQAVDPSQQCPAQHLSRTGLRKDDPLNQVPLPLRKPVYILLQDHERAQRLAQQLEFFGLGVQALFSADAFHASLSECPPSAIVMDVDFTGSGQGLLLAAQAQAQQGLPQPIPLLFFSHHETDTPTRLAAVRAGGKEFLTGTLEASSLLEKVELLTSATPHDPLRVLIIDDSRTQALHTERVLASAGMITRSLTDPIRTMAELADFQPDQISLDLYMPACTGPELAKVIRHNDRYVSVPIIYLSAEDDLDKQLDAMSEGGDDFLTKPFRSRHLITTVRNRAARARHLKSRMVRDSLTGLYNHPHPAIARRLQLPRPARAAAAELRHARYRPFQADQRPPRAPDGRPGDQEPGTVPQATAAQDRFHWPLWWRRVRHRHAQYRTGCRAQGAGRDPSAVCRNSLSGAAA